MLERVDSSIVMQDQIVRQAQLTVCARSYGENDTRILLDMLGLHADPVRYPSVDVSASGTRRAPSTGPHAPLPSDSYGAVVG